MAREVENPFLTVEAELRAFVDERAARAAHPTEPGVVQIVFGQSQQWRVTLVDDDALGFDWFAYRLGVLWAKGWVRTRSQRTAELTAKRASAEIYAAALQTDEVQS